MYFAHFDEQSDRRLELEPRLKIPRQRIIADFIESSQKFKSFTEISECLKKLAEIRQLNDGETLNFTMLGWITEAARRAKLL